MLFVGVMLMFGVFVVIQIGVTILGDYKATEVEDKETSVERDVRTSHAVLSYHMWCTIIVNSICLTVAVDVHVCMYSHKLVDKSVIVIEKYMTMRV